MKRFVCVLLLSTVLTLGACASDPERDAGGGPTPFQIARKKGQAYLERGVPAMAIPALRQARELRPDDPDVLLMLGMAYDQAERPVQALEALEKAHALRPGDGRINNNLGVALMRLERLEAARVAFEAAFADVNFPTPEEVAFNLALLYRGQGRQREMVEALERAVRFRPGFAPALMELAAYHREMGRPDLERMRLRRVLEEEPEHLPALERLAELYQGEGKVREAREMLLRVRSLEPEGEAARRAAEKLAILEKVP